ncbi:MAG: DUF3995 domain-containing protein [Bacteroidota bacterium]
MVPLLAIVLSVPLALISALHFYWAFGGHLGASAVIPTKPEPSGPLERAHVFSPGPVATAGVATLLVVAALIPLAVSGLISVPVPSTLVRLGIWTLAVVFLLRAIGDFRYVGLTKRVRGTPFAKADTRLYTPLCFGLSAVAFVLAVGSA